MLPAPAGMGRGPSKQPLLSALKCGAEGSECSLPIPRAGLEHWCAEGTAGMCPKLLLLRSFWNAAGGGKWGVGLPVNEGNFPDFPFSGWNRHGQRVCCPAGNSLPMSWAPTSKMLCCAHASFPLAKQPLHEVSVVTQRRHRCCFVSSGEHLVSEMPCQIRRLETCSSLCLVMCWEEEEGNLDLCCTPAGRDLAYGLMSWLQLGPKCHLFRQNSHRLQRGVLPE